MVYHEQDYKHNTRVIVVGLLTTKEVVGLLRILEMGYYSNPRTLFLENTIYMVQDNLAIHTVSWRSLVFKQIEK